MGDGGSSEIGGICQCSVLGITFSSFSRWVASSLHFKFASIRDSTGGNGWVWGGAKLCVRSPSLGGYKIIVGKK